MVDLYEIKKLIAGNVPPYVYNDKFKPGVNTVYYSGPYWDENEVLVAMNAFLNDRWVTSGENVKKFEFLFSKKFGCTGSTMVNSGSSANLVMMAALKKHFKWEDGSEIIVSPVGFPTTISSIYQNRMTPVFVDIEWQTLNFDLTMIQEKITPKTKAIFVSPVLGNPPDMDFLVWICEQNKILLIGDNCDSLGSKWDGKYLNTYYTAFSNSFYPAHHITTGEGGMVCVNNNELLRKMVYSMVNWGRDCHPAGTTIYTKEGIKNIEDVALRDEVYTHTGSYKKVNELIRRNYSGDLFEVKSKRNEDITATAKHPLYILRDGKYSWVMAKDLKVGDFLLQKTPDTSFKEVLNVEYKVYNNKKAVKKEYGLDKDLFRLIGYWMAEGSLAKGLKGMGSNYKENKYYSYRVDFSFNVEENEYIDDVSYLMKKFFNSSVSKRYRGKGIMLGFKSRSAYEFLLKYCNKGASNKKLHWSFVHYDSDLLREFVKGYWRGDGNGSWQSFSMATTSFTLANQLRLILSKFGISPSIQTRTIDKHKSAIVNGKEIKAKNNLYTVIGYGSNYKLLGELLDEKYTTKEKRHYTSYISKDKKYALHEIIEISHWPVENYPVFNFEVDDDHSYHANGIVSHNCYCVGAANLLPDGTCGTRFAEWLDNYEGVVDHKYVFTNMGYNLKPLDLQGAIGVEQLKKFDEIHERRVISKETIEKIFLQNIEGISEVESLENSEPCWFGTPFICNTPGLKHRLVAYLEKNKIQTRNYFAGNILLHDGYAFLDDYKKYPEANKVLDKVFFVGASPHYRKPVFDYIEDVVKLFKL